ncbi:hypothetical protein J1N35_013021 [Gossypium stocksii]|uniref:Pentacotripeptide-repeat region of PRORP domain-containing protein n=1 Tax=Gossypium stocksii TaxID=47602 RepID=A0A9D3VRQ5_9ROSI|nr:hypothetical protein J1N35_013021 [Gossypium stocksii]
MRKRLFNSLLSYSKSPHFPPRNPQLNRIIFQFFSTSSPGNLDGLIDPDDPFPLQNNPRVEPVSAQDFAFLSSDSGTSSKQKVNARKFSLDAVLIANTILSDNGELWYRTQIFLRQFRGSINEKLVVEVLNLVKMKPDLAVKFFIWAGKQSGYSHTVNVINSLLDLLESGNDDPIPEKFLLEIRDDDEVILKKLLNLLIGKYCENGLWNMALEELGRLKNFGYKPSRVTYCALVQVFLQADRLDTAHLVYGEMSDAGFRMDGYTLRCYVYSLCRTGQWREALALIEKEEFKLDTAFYTKMISGLCEALLFEEAMDFLNRMRADSCVPDVVTYRVLLCGCLNKGQLDMCKIILNMMIAEGCYPSLGIFNSLVHAYCRSVDYSFAYKLLKEMVKCGCQPGHVAYNKLISSICGNEELPSSDVLELAENAYSKMLADGVVLNKINVSNFARCLCSVGKFEKACKIIHEMMRKGFIPDTSTYSKVIAHLCNASKVENAFLLFEEMKKNGVVPDVRTYTILIDSFSKVGLIEQARNWFDEMIEKACQIFARMQTNAEIPDVDLYFKEVDNEAKTPNVYTYGALVDGLCKAYKVKEAHELLEAMSASGCKPNRVVFGALIDGFCKVGKLDKAQEVFSKMLEHEQMGSKGCAPDFVTYKVLINHCCNVGQLDKAHELLEEMTQTHWQRHISGYRKIIEGFNKDFIMSLGLLDEVRKSESLPVIPLYRMLSNCFIKAGRLEAALQLHQELASFSRVSTAYYSTCNALIESLSLAGKVNEAFELYSDMTRMGGVPEISTFIHLIKGLITVNKWEEALQLSDSFCQMDIQWL